MSNFGLLPNLKELDVLEDLNSYGVHITNDPSTCIVCGGHYPAADMGIIPTCSGHCAQIWGEKNPINSNTVWLVKRLPWYSPAIFYYAIVKIDGEYYIIGGCRDIFHFSSLKKVEGVHIPGDRFQIVSLYQSDRQKMPVYVVHLSLEELVTKVIDDLSERVRFRRWPFLRDVCNLKVFVRLYLRPLDGNHKEFVIESVQLVDTAEEPYLEQYHITSFPDGVILVRFSAISSVVSETLKDIRCKIVTDAIAIGMVRNDLIQLVGADAKKIQDAWVLLDVYSDPKIVENPTRISHRLSDVTVMPI